MERRLAIIVGSALLVQLFVRYWGQVEEGLRWGPFFFYATAVARIGAPLVICAALGLSLRQLGIAAAPRLRRREGVWLLGGMAVATLGALLLLGMDSYQASYQGLGSGYGRLERWLNWSAFTVSTTLPWELFHRGFVLFGLREVLRAGGRGGSSGDTIAIAITASFEVLYHMVKPHPLESFAMLVGSPGLSWLALRHGSVWIAVLIHVWIEFLWFMSVWQ